MSKGAEKAVAVHFSKVTSMTSIQDNTENLEQLFQAYVNSDFSEKLGDEQRLSVEDKRILQMMDDSIEIQDGHYNVMLPFRDRSTRVPNNRIQAVMYATRLKQKLMKNEKLCKQYTEFMEDLEEKGYSERVPPTEIEQDDDRVWYIPHHAVYNPRKPDKIRVVYNCPATYKGTSLNGQLLQGPDLTNQLTGVLIRWRLEPVAVTADIEAMFYQVRVKKEDCNMLRYLWWPNGDLTSKLEEYRMLVHVFGAISSPSCANFALRKIAQECLNSKPKVADVILNSFYVDDMLQSFQSESEAVEVSKNTKETLKEYGFNLPKWLSNNREVLESMPIEDRAKDVKNLNLDKDPLPMERTLGIQWNVQTDELGFSFEPMEKAPSRRTILSKMSSIYDPLGMVAPYVLKAKMILQSLCQTKIGWDEQIPPEEAHEWEAWTKDLPKLSEVKLQRCLKPAAFVPPTQVQLHHFAAASDNGYGTVSYIRYQKEDQIHCAFVVAKARVSPLKKITIPRLELTAAVVAVRVNNKLQKELRMPIEKTGTHYWTDSQTVLKYISNETSRFHTFVANHVEEIREGSETSQWRYVPTANNPADDCSRGLTMEKLLKSERWFNGPEFLWKNESEWPKCTLDHQGPLSSEDPEVKRSRKQSVATSTTVGVGVVKAGEVQDPVTTMVQFYSSWNRLKRAVAWWLRLKIILKQRSKGQREYRESKYLSLHEIQQAEEIIVKTVQEQAFPEEIAALTKMTKLNSDQTTTEKKHEEDTNQDLCATKQGIPKSSSILSLDPVISDGILRVGGRLRNASIPEEAKHQLILPKAHRVVDLIISHIHRQCNHQGRNHVLAEMRKRFWVIRAGVAVKKIVKRCIVCRRQHVKIGTQQMADLPSNRVKPDEPPFTSTGMDYFGPFDIKQGRSTRKWYGVLFTCMASRAIHIEITDSMDTSACINALRRFISRRGRVKEITSDNGTNIVGANQELRKAIEEFDEETIQRFACSKAIKWKFNPPAASHHGGVWERHIRTVRKILLAILNEQHLKVCHSHDQLHTLMCEIEMTINSRPLTQVSEDQSDLEVITPNQLLHPWSQEYLPPGVFNERDNYAKRRWRQVQYLANIFWKRWIAEYLPLLQKRQKWLQPTRNLQVGDIVLIADSNAPRNSWPMGKVEKVNVGSKGYVRSASVRTKTSLLTRPISKLVLLLEQEL